MVRLVVLACLLPRMRPGHPSSPLVHLFPFFYWLYLFSFLPIPSLYTRIVPLRFQAGGRRRRPNLGLVNFFLFLCVCVICVICIR